MRASKNSPTIAVDLLCSHPLFYSEGSHSDGRWSDFRMLTGEYCKHVCSQMGCGFNYRLRRLATFSYCASLVRLVRLLTSDAIWCQWLLFAGHRNFDYISNDPLDAANSTQLCEPSKKGPLWLLLDCSTCVSIWLETGVACAGFGWIEDAVSSVESGLPIWCHFLSITVLNQ